MFSTGNRENDLDEEIKEILEEEVEKSDEYSSIDEMLDDNYKKTLSVRLPILKFAEYQRFADEARFPSKSEAAREGLDRQLDNRQQEQRLVQGWSTYLAGLDERDPNVVALGLDAIYEVSHPHGKVAEKYMDSILEELGAYEE